MGGTPRAVRDIKHAMGGEVISFTQPHLLGEAGDGTVHVTQSISIVGRLYGMPKRGRAHAAQACLDRADVMMIHGCFRHHYQWAAREAQRRNLPYLVIPHGALDPHVFTYRGLQKHLWWCFVGQPAMTRASGVICMTQRELDKAGMRARLPALRYVIHLPVELPQLDDRAEQRLRMRRKLGIGETDRVLMFLGRFDPFKRLPEIISAFARVPDPTLRLVIAGPESPEMSFTACRRLAGASIERLHLPGAVYGEDKHALFAAADALVSASARENFGYSLCEGLAAGLPAIIGPGNDLAPELAEARCGWFLERDDVDTLARAYAWVATTPAEELSAMGDRGRTWVREHLGRDQFRRALERACNEARR